jgi:hypothetical protein
MATPDHDARVEELYRLPLDQFTGARNALAKELKQPQIKELEKPSIAAWAVNQLYWKERRSYDALTHAGERLHGEHRTLISGKPADIRSAEQAHREAMRAAVDKVRTLLNEGGHAATEATLTAVQETLKALPSNDPPGRLVKPLKPRGFEALAGIPTGQASGVRRQAPGAKPQGPGPRPQVSGSTDEAPTEPRSQHARGSALTLVKSTADQKRERDDAIRREQEERERKERQREAAKALKAAEAAMLRAEEAVKKAEKALGELRRTRDAAVSEYQRARLRARE